jgi:7,8-dihydroneopterin aldolase/epimerase/oxygenase
VTDRILLQNLVFYGYHGVRSEEKSLGQRFGVDIELQTDLSAAGRSDDLGLTVDYSQVFEVVRETVEGPSRDTLEAVAEAAAVALLERFQRVQSVVVRVTKPGAPIKGAQVGSAAVEITRQRQTESRG